MIGVSTSTYYYRPKRSRRGRELEDAEIRDAIEAITCARKKFILERAARYEQTDCLARGRPVDSSSGATAYGTIGYRCRQHAHVCGSDSI